MITFSKPAANGPGDPVAAIFEQTAGALGAEQTAASGIPQAAIPGDPGGDTVESFDTQAFLLTGVSQIVSHAVIVAKLAGGWSSPAVPGPNGTFLLTEEDWQAAVAKTGVAVIEKRWPSLADKVTPEFALLAMVAPWILTNLAPTLIGKIIPFAKRILHGKQPPSDRDIRRNRDRENVSATAPVESPAAGFSPGSD